MTAKRDAIVEIERIAYDVEQGAAALGINSDRMAAMIREGAIPHMMVGSRVLIGKRALEAWLTRQCLATVEANEMPTVRRIRAKRSA